MNISNAPSLISHTHTLLYMHSFLKDDKTRSLKAQALLLWISICHSNDANLSHGAEINHRIAFYAKRSERVGQLFQPDIITTSIDEVSTTARPLVKQIRKLPAKIKKLVEMLPHQEA